MQTTSLEKPSGLRLAKSFLNLLTDAAPPHPFDFPRIGFINRKEGFCYSSPLVISLFKNSFTYNTLLVWKVFHCWVGGVPTRLQSLNNSQFLHFAVSKDKTNKSVFYTLPKFDYGMTYVSISIFSYFSLSPMQQYSRVLNQKSSTNSSRYGIARCLLGFFRTSHSLQDY